MNAHIRIGNQILNTANIASVTWYDKTNMVKVVMTVPGFVYTYEDIEAIAFIDAYTALTGTVDAMEMWMADHADDPDVAA